MRKFSSYGPVDTDLHFYVPRQGLIDRVLNQLVGEVPERGGHYITVWAPRQRGKTWILQRVFQRLDQQPYAEQFDVVYLAVESLKKVTEIKRIIHAITEKLGKALQLELHAASLDEFELLFSRQFLQKPLILIMDEFDALSQDAIAGIAGVLRNIYTARRNQLSKLSHEKEYLLHGVALIGVRSVLGIENETGSPFNVQRSVQIPNLTFAEVEELYQWYERESGQKIEEGVVERIYEEVEGQPGLTSWLGELLTETYNSDLDNPLTLEQLDWVMLWATDGLGNANVQNIISKAQQTSHRDLILELFRTEDKLRFRFDNPTTNFLYLNGVIDIEETPTQLNIRFPNPFIQRRLFNYFSSDIFPNMGQLYAPFEDLSDTITETSLNVRNLLKHYQHYLQQNRDWLLQEVPRKANMRPYEAVFHFNLYLYLSLFFQRRNGKVHPEFPTGNSQIDLIIQYAGQRFGIEVKSFTDDYEYRQALKQAARYGKQLGLAEITLVFFVEAIDDANRQKYEEIHADVDTETTVLPVFVTTE
ncbi:AAA-like domain-containing protein [Chloroflexi bacterium TSY]|nr:AAA-like domain-containing protein [Chloroflexi bacterium TSY]